ILCLLVLMLSISTMWNTSNAGWIVGDQVDISKGFDKDGNYIFMPIFASKFENRYMTTDQRTKGLKIGAPNILDDESIWNFEEGPINSLGYPTIYIRQHSTGKYIPTDTWNEDMALTDDIVGAATYQVLSCSVDIPWANTIAWTNELKPGHEDEDKIENWRVNSNNGEDRRASDISVGFAFFEGEGDDMSYEYLAIWNGPGCMNWGYTDTNQWDVYEAIFVEDYQADLSAYVDQCQSEFNPTGDGGADITPGYYVTSYVDAYNTALEWATLASLMDDMDNDFYISAMNDLKQARTDCEDHIIPLTEGYYRFVSAYEGFLNNQGVEKAAYGDDDLGLVCWNTLNETDPNQVFKLTKAEDDDEWNMQCFGNDKYVAGQEDWYGQRTPITEGIEEAQNIRLRLEGMWFWGSHSEHNTSLCPDPYSGEKGKTLTWSQWGDHECYQEHQNLWYIRPVSDAEMETLLPIKEQFMRNKEMAALKKEATDIYNNLFAYSTSEEKLITDASQMITNSNLVDDTNVGNLLDDDPETYLRTNEGYTDEAHYLQIDISNNPASIVTFIYDRRRGDDDANIRGENERPAQVTIYATNDTTNGGEWIKIAESYHADMPLPVKWSCNLGAEYKYVRFVNEMNKEAENRFSLGSFQIFKAEFDQANSQYFSVTGMQSVADNMMDVKRAKDAIENVSEQDVTEMRNALAAVKTLYADTVAVRKLIEECKMISEGITIGEEIGELPEEQASLKDDLEQAILDAEVAIVNTPNNKAILDEATNKLNAAKTAINGNISFIEEGKWYFIANADAERSGEPGTEDSWCSGNVIYAKDASGTADINWGYYDQETFDLTTVNDPKTMWTFKKVEGTDYYYIQNMYSGIYLGACNGESERMRSSKTPIPYRISFIGSKQFTLTPISDTNKRDYVLYAAGGEDSHVICSNKRDAYTAGAWKFTEATEELTSGIIVLEGFAFNLVDVFAVPYAHENLADYNEDCHWYRIKKLEGNAENGYTAVVLTEGTSFNAGESSIYIGGSIDPEDDFISDNQIMIPMPEMVVDKAWSGAACNGILGQISGDKCPVGSGCSDGKTFFPFTSESGVGPLTGVINPGDYQGEIESSGISEDVTITFNGVLKNPTAIKYVKKNAIVKNVIGVNAVAGKSIVPGVYIQEGKKIVE
ncbi:MAG: hypothetical protein KBT27_11785, partial [Prevotellaceae bacterium]|nr:hypothetical protein [Candidatus Faecinaster equi]